MIIQHPAKKPHELRPAWNNIAKTTTFCLHSRTNKNRLVIQIQKALWRKLKPLFSRNKMLYASKTEVTENALALEGKSFRPDTKTTVNRCVPWPLSVQQAAKISVKMYNLPLNLPDHNLPSRGKNLIETSSILAWVKIRVGLPPHFNAIRTR